MQALFILNDPPYGTERSYNALRLAGSLSKQTGENVRVFLIGEGAACAHGHQKVPQGHYNIEIMLKTVVKHGGEVGVCSSCMDARGISDADLVEGAKRSSMDELTEWSRDADKVFVF
ncbi:MAG TPA: DsrE family protein [Steroidobacteraceae bacterium]